MNKLLKISLKYFCVVTIIYGLLLSFLDLVTVREFSFYDIIEGCAIFGFAMTIVLVSYLRYEVKRIAREYGIVEADLDVKHTRKFQSNLDLEKIFEQIEMRDYYREVKLDQVSNLIQIKTGYVGKSWGDIITIERLEKDQYKISSQPKFPLTIIDFGQNLENILKLKHRINVFEKNLSI
ncbi:hypothetical protein [Christiangramia sp. SM2212]|uniref:Photosystem I assembly protein Ycf4 n=1 Tax=Christiangramia sediminicola TaxID=3073267 RepID=A0ABU1EPL2_9FLAO|nr:hypothetical protein [Christiangramia sp. SM2212]MDR5589914.1 hypothetical protein [Christiangramia sp. SM2212]